MTQHSSPWIDRFRGLDEPKLLRERAFLPARPLVDLGRDLQEYACDRLKLELDSIFAPTESALKVLLTWVERARSYALTHYQNQQRFLSRCYDQEVEVEDSILFCLTGLAGVGKSQIRKAFFRILPPDGTVEVIDHGRLVFPLTAGRLIVVKSRQSVLQIYRTLARAGAFERGLSGEPAWLRECQQWLYQCGVCAVGLDELQFLTQSEKANTLVARVLMAVSYLGPPAFFTCNYSLGHRMMRRPQEERQRLLARIHVLHPDPYDSECWRLVLREFQNSAPDVFRFDIVGEARQLWNLTAGIKRNLAQLFVLAYRQVRRKSASTVSITDLLAAYHSIEFCTQRQDVELLFTYGIKGVKGRSDLSCPFSVSSVEAEKYTDALQMARREKVASAAMKAVMTKEERQSVQAIQTAAAPKVVKQKQGNVHELKIPASKTLEALQRAGQKFKEDLQ
ncbi:MAG: hypothetical protein Q7K57_08235 [Burkholderiaceae bacterium]|nr:hypothetical protein [Burkholderiaceae bacterium]